MEGILDDSGGREELVRMVTGKCTCLARVVGREYLARVVRGNLATECVSVCVMCPSRACKLALRLDQVYFERRTHVFVTLKEQGI